MIKSVFYKRGVSLVELIIYIAIFVVVAGLLTGIFVNFVGIQSKESAGAEVTSQLNFTLQKIQSAVKNSSNIEISTSSVTSNLKLRMPNSSSTDPTCIYLSNGKVRIVEGPDNSNPLFASQNCKADSEAQDLTNDKVVVDKLEFKKTSFGVGHDTVSVDMQMTYNTDNSRLSVTRTLQSAIARVSAATFDSDLIPSSAYNFSLGQSSKGWGNIYVGDGAAGTPSYTFGSQTNLGIFKAASNVFGFATQGIERMRIDGSGNVGIGTASPGAKLDVYDNTTASSWVGKFLNNVDAVGESSGILFGNISSQGVLGHVYNTTDANRYVSLGVGGDDVFGGVGLSVKKGGNVGIGTASPGAPLEIYKDGTAADVTGGGLIVSRYRNGSNYRGGSVYSRYIGAAGSDALVFGVTTGDSKNPYSDFDQARMVILANGNVGIGTTNPGYKLEVLGGTTWNGTFVAGGHFIQDKTNYRGIGIGYDTSSQTGVIAADTGGAASNIAFWTFNGSAWGEKVRIDGNGNMGIGMTSSGSKLQISASDDSVAPGLSIRQSNATGNGWDFNVDQLVDGKLYIDGMNAGVLQNRVMTLDRASGKVGIGTSGPNAKLQVSSGDIYVDTVGSGIILKSPDGACHRVTVSNSNTFTSVTIACP